MRLGVAGNQPKDDDDGSGIPSSHRHPDRMMNSLDLACVTREAAKPLHEAGTRRGFRLFPAIGLCPKKGGDMTSTAVLTEDSTTIVAEEANHFRWASPSPEPSPRRPPLYSF